MHGLRMGLKIIVRADCREEGGQNRISWLKS